MYLFDTNIWLERILDQDNSDVVGKLLDQISTDEIFITDFSFHSICLILTRLGHPQTLVDFINDVVLSGDITLLTISPEDIVLVVDAMAQLGLDFDDGYQYVIAEQSNLVIVSFDRDFDTTPLGKETPTQILARL